MTHSLPYCFFAAQWIIQPQTCLHCRFSAACIYFLSFLATVIPFNQLPSQNIAMFLNLHMVGFSKQNTLANECPPHLQVTTGWLVVKYHKGRAEHQVSLFVVWVWVWVTNIYFIFIQFTFFKVLGVTISVSLYLQIGFGCFILCWIVNIPNGFSADSFRIFAKCNEFSYFNPFSKWFITSKDFQKR